MCQSTRSHTNGWLLSRKTLPYRSALLKDMRIWTASPSVIGLYGMKLIGCGLFAGRGHSFASNPSAWFLLHPPNEEARSGSPKSARDDGEARGNAQEQEAGSPLHNSGVGGGRRFPLLEWPLPLLSLYWSVSSLPLLSGHMSTHLLPADTCLWSAVQRKLQHWSSDNSGGF